MKVILKNEEKTLSISSKFEREVGDQMRIEGETFEVVFVGTEEEVNIIMRKLIAIRNKEIRLRRKIEKAEDDRFLFNVLNEARLSVNESLPTESAIGISTVKELMKL